LVCKVPWPSPQAKPGLASPALSLLINHKFCFASGTFYVCFLLLSLWTPHITQGFPQHLSSISHSPHFILPTDFHMCPIRVLHFHLNLLSVCARCCSKPRAFPALREHYSLDFATIPLFSDFLFLSLQTLTEMFVMGEHSAPSF
jgi:hypothetical protein